MKRKLYMMMGAAALGLLTANAAKAEFVFGEETKGITLTSNESDLNIRIRLQPRFDFGDLVKSEDGRSYESESDLYLRRVRLEMGGHLLTKTIKYNLTLSADKWEQTGHADEVSLLYGYVEWDADEAYSFQVGKYKLPYSRVSLTSSSKQLLIERPASTEAAKKVFGETDAYYQPKAAIFGKALDGVLGYEVAVADGWQNGETIHTDTTVFPSSPLYVARIELSPPGWLEKSKSDAHLGKGQHLTLGLNLANQSSIEYAENGYEEDRSLWGFDVSGHYNNITAQAEYNEWEVDSSDPTIGTSKPRGWYVQAGYLVDGLNIEPVARYEVYDQNSEAENKEERNTTFGANWYGKGHSLKVGANWVHTDYDSAAKGALAEADSKDTYQVQAQMYF